MLVILPPFGITPGSTATFMAYVDDPDGIGDITSVIIDLSALPGGGTLELFDDGAHSDVGANDGIFGNTYQVPAGTSGDYNLPVTATDSVNNTDDDAYTLTVN